MKKIDDLGEIFFDLYKPNVDSVSNNCWKGCVFIRFTIDKHRQFTKIGYTKSTPPFILDALQKTFAKINGLDRSINQLSALKGKTYVLPLIIYNNQGCGEMSGWEDLRTYKPDPKMVETYKDRQENYEQFGTSLANMTRFTDGEVDAVNCILLWPYTLGPVMY